MTATPTMTETTTEQSSSRIVSSIPTRVLSSLSVAEQYYILEGCRDNCRSDGRSRVELRPFSLLTTDPLVLSHGSSRILAAGGNTEILCSIKAELVHPRPETPHQGVVEFHVDLGTTVDSGGDFRKRRLLEQQLQTSLTFLLQDTLVPLESLCVVPGHYAWRLHCDILVLQVGGGSVIDVASRALRGALLQTKLPHIVPLGSSNKGEATVDLAVDGDMHKAHSIVASDDTIPVIVSVAICKCPPNSTPVLVLDTTAQEELCASCMVRLSISPTGQVVAIQNANGSLPLGLLPQVTAAAVQASQHVFTAMKLAQSATAADSSAYASTNVATTLLQPQFQIR